MIDFDLLIQKPDAPKRSKKQTKFELAAKEFIADEPEKKAPSVVKVRGEWAISTELPNYGYQEML